MPSESDGVAPLGCRSPRPRVGGERVLCGQVWTNGGKPGIHMHRQPPIARLRRGARTSQRDSWPVDTRIRARQLQDRDPPALGLAGPVSRPKVPTSRLDGERGASVRFVPFSAGRGRASALVRGPRTHRPDRPPAPAGGARIVQLADSGWCVLAPAQDLSAGARRSAGAGGQLRPGRSLIRPSPRPCVTSWPSAQAVQISELFHRIGMGETPEVASRKVMSLFFACHEHHVEFQPIVDLGTLKAHEWECLFRLSPGMGSQSIADVVEAALAAKRPVNFDSFIVEATLARIAEVIEPGPAGRLVKFGVNFLPASLLSPSFEAEALADRVRAANLSPHQIIVECTEQQAVHDVPASRSRCAPCGASASDSPSMTPVPATRASPSSQSSSPRSSRSTRRSSRASGTRTPRPRRPWSRLSSPSVAPSEPRQSPRGSNPPRSAGPAGSGGRLRAGLPARPVVYQPRSAAADPRHRKAGPGVGTDQPGQGDAPASGGRSLALGPLAHDRGRSALPS